LITAVFREELLVEAELLGLERRVGLVRGGVEVVGAQAECCAQHDLVHDRGAGIDDQMAAARGAHDAPQIARVHLPDRDRGFPAQEAARADGIAVAAGDLVALAHEEARDQRAGGAGAEYEDAHVKGPVGVWSGRSMRRARQKGHAQPPLLHRLLGRRSRGDQRNEDGWRARYDESEQDILEQQPHQAAAARAIPDSPAIRAVTSRTSLRFSKPWIAE
jgi:hypothetical protein